MLISWLTCACTISGSTGLTTSNIATIAMSARLHNSKGFCIACLSCWRLATTHATWLAIAAGSGNGLCSGDCVHGARLLIAIGISFLDASYLLVGCQAQKPG